MIGVERTSRYAERESGVGGHRVLCGVPLTLRDRHLVRCAVAAGTSFVPLIVVVAPRVRNLESGHRVEGEDLVSGQLGSWCTDDGVHVADVVISGEIVPTHCIHA